MKKILTNEKYWNLAGVVLGLVVIIMGIVFMFTPADSYSTRSADDVSFGADYYTYQYEATWYAVSNTAITANNIRELGGKIALYAGFGFIVCGALIMLNYGKKLALCMVPETKAEIPAAAVEEIPAAE